MSETPLPEMNALATEAPVVPLDRRTALAAVLLCLVALAFWLPAAAHPDWWIRDNGDRTLAIAGAERETIFTYRQFPFWNPYMFGGLPLLANPQSAFLSPSFLTVILAGEVAGTKLRMLFALCAGLIGAWLLGRRLAEGQFAPYVLAAVFMLSSWYPLYMGTGHEEFIACGYIPWVVLFFHAGLERMRYALAAGAFFALMVLEGGIYPVPYTALLLCLYCAYLCIERFSLRPFLTLAVMFCFAGVIGGIKMLPLLDFMRDNPRVWTHWEKPVPLSAFRLFFFHRDQVNGKHFPDDFYGWQEYGAYVGWITAGLALVGLLLAWRRALPWLLLGGAFVALAMGDYGPAALWRLLHKLPVFASMHDTPRFRIISVFCIAVMAAIGLGRLWTLLAARRRRAFWRNAFGCLCALVLAALFADLYIVNGRIYRGISAVHPRTVERAKAFRQFVNTDPKVNSAELAYPTFLANRGLANNYEPMSAPDAAVRGANEEGYRGEVWLEEGEGTVSTRYWSPNRLVYEVRCNSPAWLVVNQRYEKSWSAADGRTVRPRNGLISVRVSSKDGLVTLRYMPRTFPLGCAMSFAGLCALVLTFAPGRFARRLAARRALMVAARCAARVAAGLRSPQVIFILLAIIAAAAAILPLYRRANDTARARNEYLASEPGIRARPKGITGEFFVFDEPVWHLPDLSGLKPKFTLDFNTIDFPPTSTEFVSRDGIRTGLIKHFAIRFKGYLLIDEAGEYGFSVQSDDGFRLWIDEVEISAHDNLRSFTEAVTEHFIPLEAGAHKMRLEYFENGPAAGLRLSWRRPRGALEVVPASALRHGDR